MEFVVTDICHSAKELDNSNFFREVPAILKQYKWMYITVALILIAATLCQTNLLPYHWVVTRFPAIFPLFYNLGCHLLVPFILNPQVIVSGHAVVLQKKYLTNLSRNSAFRYHTIYVCCC